MPDSNTKMIHKISDFKLSLNSGHTFKIRLDEIHLWSLLPDQINDSVLSSCESLLSEKEDDRRRRFRFKKDRRQYAISRALVRTVLSGYTGIDAHKLKFSENRYEKPEIVASENSPPIRFNLSHTDGFILCGIALKDDIGVDVECTEREGRNTDEIAERYFSPSENAYLRNTSKFIRKEKFFYLWTLKEAFIKAKGLGLSMPLDRFSFDLSNKKNIKISFPERNDDSKNWRFWSIRPSLRHIAGVAAKKRARAACRLSVKKVVLD